MEPVTYVHKNYKSVVRRNPQNGTYVVYVYRDGELTERQVFTSFDAADDYAYRTIIVDDLCDRLGLR